jgi:hypothetical protein
MVRGTCCTIVICVAANSHMMRPSIPQLDARTISFKTCASLLQTIRTEMHCGIGANERGCWTDDGNKSLP